MRGMAITVLLGMALALTPAARTQEYVGSEPAAANSFLKSGDLVFVDVFRHPELSTTTQLDANGNVTIPNIGPVSLSGLSEIQASERITAALGTILKRPKATVSLSAGYLGGGTRTAEMKMEMIPLMNADAGNLSETLRGMSSQGGSVSFDPDTNTLIITDAAPVIQNMMSVVARLDKMQSQITQVRIETKIAEVRVGAMKELGVRWFVQGKEGGGGYYGLPTQDTVLRSLRGSNDPLANERVDDNSNGVGRSFVDEPNFDRRLNIPVQVPTGGQMFFGLLNDHIDLGIMLDALIADDNAELLANPSILTVNRKPAEINMIEEFPYQAFGTTDLGSVVSGTSFLDLGIKLTVTPFVKQDDTGPYVQLKLNPEVSYASGSSNGVPIRAVRSSENIANVRDAQTLVIGGIFRNELRDLEEKVPGLGNIPLLGNLFKHKEKSDVRTELMVFVTPTIHTTPETVTWDRMIDVEQLRALNPESVVLKALGEQRQGAPLTEDEADRSDAGTGAEK